MNARRQRASVEDPRPASAWVMVLVATATLTITGQLAIWAIVAALMAIGFSFARRLTPLRHQRSPIVLNLGLGAILLLSSFVFLQTHSSTIALAHFAALTQGLQLMDARPRQSEFMLVTLSLFQVVLAANLTDSVFFLLLTLLFLVATSWTLMVHTLRSEAIEAGEHHPGPRQVHGGLIRLTAMASVFSVLLALVLFGVLPRFRSSIIQSRTANSQAVAGFTDRVELGTIGQIRLDKAVVLRVETLEGEAPPTRHGYWRGLSFDHFDGRLWSVTPPIHSAPGGSPTFGIDLARRPARQALVQRIVREPVQGSVLFGAGEARKVSGAIHRVEVDVNGSLYAPGQMDERIRYTIRTEAHQPDDEALRRDRTAAPARREDAFLDLPALSGEIPLLAASIVKGAANDADRVRAVEAHLRSQGRYTDAPPAMNTAGGRSPVEGFLLDEMSGHCEYFASGMVILVRSLGIPSRLVNGFAGGRKNELGDFVELRRSDAHTWVEVHYEDAGWVRYDPTPPDLRLRAAVPPSFADHLSDVASAIELWWYQRVVDFDTSDQVQAIRFTYSLWQAWHEPAPRPEQTDGLAPASNWKIGAGKSALPVLLLVLIVAGGIAIARRLEKRSEGSVPMPGYYASALRLLRRRGHTRTPSCGARDFAATLEARIPEAASTAFRSLTESYLAERFGAHPASAGSEELAVLRRELPRARRSGRSQSA